jgi:tetratricopeptide (TPR) repeat protein
MVQLAKSYFSLNGKAKVKDINEYNSGMTEHEFFSFLYEKIVSKEIISFSKLRELVSPVLRDKWTHPIIMKAFQLLKQLNWGFFSAICPNTHKKLWKEMVIPDRDFPEAGDLKKTLQISNLYIAMLDIHGYTKFCMDSRKNLSMMHTLDWAIENEIRRISTQCGAISQRERGDEMVVVAASATDALMVTLCIIDYFGKTEIVGDPQISTKRIGNAAALPVFKITAGITGGNTQSPLIITERGNLSGFLLNSGARLQTRANELSPKESRVMIAKQVMMNYEKENAAGKCILALNDSIYFFDTGHIEFKGVMIPTCEVVFDKNERYKEKFAEDMTKLFASIRDNLWEQRIYQDLMELLKKVAQSMPKFSITPASPIQGMQTITNESYVQLCRLSMKAYYVEEDYYQAMEYLRHLVDISEQIPLFDRLILDYLKGITEKYNFLLGIFETHIDKEVDEKAAHIFHGDHYKAWVTAKNAARVYEKLRAIGRKSKDISKKKNIWLNLLSQYKEQMEFTLYSGKK